MRGPALLDCRLLSALCSLHSYCAMHICTRRYCWKGEPSIRFITAHPHSIHSPLTHSHESPRRTGGNSSRSSNRQSAAGSVPLDFTRGVSRCVARCPLSLIQHAPSTRSFSTLIQHAHPACPFNTLLLLLVLTYCCCC